MLKELVISSLSCMRLGREKAERKENVTRKEKLINGTKCPQHEWEKKDFSSERSNGFQDEPSSSVNHSEK